MALPQGVYLLTVCFTQLLVSNSFPDCAFFTSQQLSITAGKKGQPDWSPLKQCFLLVLLAAAASQPRQPPPPPRDPSKNV